MMVWMEYSLLVAVLLTLAAHGAERVVRLNGRATRWVWLGALLLSFALPAVLPWLVRELASDGAGLLVPSTTLTLTLPPVVTSGSPVISWTRVVQAAWVIASALLLAYGLWSLWRLHRSRRGWESATVLNHDVLLSSDVGPAVVGVLDPVIVLPQWVPTLSESEQGLILAHEGAHIEAGDPWLMRVAQVAPVLMPWNVALWLQARRLRECVELDCDARLLAAGEDADGYAELLLCVGERATRTVLAAAMAEPRSLLEKRIMRMFERKPRAALLRASAWGAVALIAFVAAFNAPLPARAALPMEARGAQPKDDPAAPREVPQLAVQLPPRVQPPQDVLPQEQQQQEPQPTFTPFTVPPQLKNQSDVIAALEAYYPPLLRQAAVGGVVKLWFHIDENGEVIHLRIKQGSGHAALDDAALKVAGTMKFTPALNRDARVTVWVDMPIIFRPGKSDPEANLTPEQKARLDENRRAEAYKALSEQYVTRLRGDSVVTERRAQAQAATPTLLNAEEVARGLQRYYPPLLRDAGIGGEVLVWFYVNKDGLVEKTALKRSSGHQALDDAALRVAAVMRFAPAQKDGQPISVWIDMPITFRTQ